MAAWQQCSLQVSHCPPGQIEDVTGKYGKEEELVTCGICELLDPPVDPEYPVPSTETTEWVGCDCYRLFLIFKTILQPVLAYCELQGCGSRSAWIRISLSCWIRIRIQEGKKTHNNRKK